MSTAIPQSSLDADSRLDNWEVVADCLDRFAAAWNATGQPPGLRDFLPRDGGDPWLALLELIKLDMEYRWKAEIPLRVEEYLREHGELFAGRAAPLELVVEELHLRRKHQRTFDPQTYRARFPELAERLQPFLALTEGTSTLQLVEPGLAGAREMIAAFRPGDQVDDFDLVRKLGAGSFATVFLAWQRSMQRWVGLKLAAKGTNEPQTLARLEHPFIVRVFDVRTLGPGKPHLLYMEYVPGGTLQQALQNILRFPRQSWNGRLLLEVLDEFLKQRHESPPRDSLNRRLLESAGWGEAVCILGSHLALALDYAQQRGVLHRDVKPANILLSRAAFPKLADFNVSFGSEVQGATAAAHFGGSMAYMSPEQLAAMHPAMPMRPEDLDGASDQYALGIVLWELLTGERPFPDAPEDSGWLDALEFLRDARHEEVRALPAAAARDAPPALHPTLLRCLERDPADRFATPGELSRQLLLCAHADVQRLLWQPISPWLRWTTYLPLLALFLIAIVPNVVLSGLNIAYNQHAVARGWAPDLFDEQVGIVNLVVYSLALALIYGLGAPVTRGIARRRRGAAISESHAALAQRLLNRAWQAASATLVLWTCCGVVFPVWTHWVAGDAQLSRYGHFFLSQLVCGVIAALLVYFLMTFVSLRAWLPVILAPTDIAPDLAQRLAELPRRLRWCFVLYALMPSLCLLLLPFGSLEFRFPFLALGLVGLGGLVLILWMMREIERDAAALRIVLSSEPGRGEGMNFFDTAYQVWSSARQ